MTFEQRVTLPGSERKTLPGAQPAGGVDPSETVQVSIILRRKGPEPTVRGVRDGSANLSHEQFARKYGAASEDISLIKEFADQFELTMVESSEQKRRVVLTGTVEAMTKAFGAELGCYTLPESKQNYRLRSGSLTVPKELAEMVVAVLGLDNRPVAKPHFRVKPNAAATFTPPQIASLYNFPTGVDGTGETIGIIELGGGYQTADLDAYFQGLGIAVPSVTAISVDGGENSPGSDADGEVELDIQVAGSIAPGAKLAVYFTPNTDQGFIDAVIDSVHDTQYKPSVVSISWGGPEDSWTPQSQQALNQALQDAAMLGVTVTVAAGDDGSTDGANDNMLHVDFPASSPYALACGGTTLQASGNTISSEVVWNETANQEGATGGGISNSFALPTYQNSAQVPKQPETGNVGRGVPDVAGNADPSTGYQVRIDGQDQIVGGTSAIAPLWAALIALINQQSGKASGFINPALYAGNGSGFHDITSGDNDDSGLGYYQAQTGWDPCTGLGSPDGQAIASLLNSATTTTASGAGG